MQQSASQLLHGTHISALGSGMRCSQLEALLIFECIDREPFSLRDAWTEVLPLSLLENLAQERGGRV